MPKYVFWGLFWGGLFLSPKAWSQNCPELIQANADVFQFWMDSCSNELIIDVRESQEYNKGAIPEAVNAPDKKTLLAICDTLDLDMPILIYCSHGDRSLKAGTILLEKGFLNVLNLKQGYNAWPKQKLKRN